MPGIGLIIIPFMGKISIIRAAFVIFNLFNVLHIKKVLKNKKLI